MQDRSGARRGYALLSLVAFLFLFATPGTTQAEEPLARGARLLDAGRYAEAERALDEAVAAQPDSAKAHYYLGLAHSRQKDYRAAVRALEKALDLDPDLKGAHLSLGIAYYRTTAYQNAVKALARSMGEDPHNGSGLFLLGMSHASLGDYDKAIFYLERAATADESFEQLAWYNVGLSHSRAGRKPEAQRALERAIEVDPKSATASAARELADLVAKQERDKPWSLSAVAGVEFDDNVTTSETDTTTSKDDGAAVMEVSGRYKLLEQPDRELEAGYDFYQSAYFDLEDFNLHSHSFSLAGSQDLWDVDTGLSYRFTTTRLGNERFLDVASLSPSIGYMVTTGWYAMARYEFHNKNFQASPGRDAHQSAVGVDHFVFFQSNKAYASFGYRRENENSNGAEFDYTGDVLRAGWHAPWPALGPEGIIDLSYRYTTRDYDEITASIGRKRDDERHSFSIALARRVTDSLLGRLRYQYTSADSNLRSADYDQNVVSLTFEYAFESGTPSGRETCPRWKSALMFCEPNPDPATR